MIEITNISKEKPYQIFKSYYDSALLAKQKSIEAISISSFDSSSNEVESRFVNLKYIIDNKWTFFSNYESPKAMHFESHNQISALFYWQKLNLQIRLKAKIFKSPKTFSDKQIDLGSKNLEFIIKNIERSYEKIFKFTKDIDNLSLSTGKSININLIKKVLLNE